MGTVVNGQSPIQVLAQDHAASGQRPAPAYFLNLQHLLIQLHRVVAIHHPLMLDGEDPVQIAASRRQKCRAPLLRR